MAAKGQTAAYAPSMSDAVVRLKTGKTWPQWFSALDKAGAAARSHKAIATIVRDRHGVGPWWSQMVTVEYERARGLRAKHQKADGFSVSASKALGVPLAELYRAAAEPKLRKAWFPKGEFKLTSQTKDKYFRGSWNEGARLEIGFMAKDAARSQIAVQVNKLAGKSEVEAERAAWKQALVKLATLLAGP